MCILSSKNVLFYGTLLTFPPYFPGGTVIKCPEVSPWPWQCCLSMSLSSAACTCITFCDLCAFYLMMYVLYITFTFSLLVTGQYLRSSAMASGAGLMEETCKVSSQQHGHATLSFGEFSTQERAQVEQIIAAHPSWTGW